MKRYKYILIIFLFIIVFINVPVTNRFTISNGKTGKIVYMDDVDNAKEFIVSFRHSVNRTLVNEFIKANGNKFIVYKTTFYSYGAGMPEYDAQSNQKVTVNNGLVEIENIDRVLEDFTYIVGTYADHILSYKDKSMKLSEFVEPQNPAFFKIRKVSFFELIKYKLN